MGSELKPDDFSQRDTIAMSSPEASGPRSFVASGPPELIAGRYQILALLGEGGMGSVYRARDTELDELVALKVLKEELTGSPELAERFRREVKLARRVTHPNVARMFDIGEHGGLKFLTMELIDGESLADRLHRVGRLSVPDVVQVGVAVAAGLSAAHRAGVIHRDLKPDNVMLGRDGRILITDFGIAREPIGGSVGATAGMVIGTPAYMAPEQVEASPDIDARADLYALGAMLFELFTGEPPFQGTSPIAVASARLYAPPPDPAALRSGLSPELAGIVTRCMARRREDRYASADEVAAALEQARGSVPVPSVRPPSATAVADTGPVVRDKTVAVLPFRNQGVPDDEYVAEGLTDDLIDALSMTPGLRVRPRGAVSRFRSGDIDPRDVGRELGVQVVVEGGVRRAGSQVRLTARVISVHDGFQLWAQRFDRPANDLLVVSDETARAVAHALTLESCGRNRVAVTDAVAVDLYLHARAELRKLWPVHVVRALEHFRAAYERAPEDVSILAGYARACARSWFFTGKGAELARELAAKALAKAPEDPEALLASANVELQDGEHTRAAAYTRQALARAPDNPDAIEMRGRLLLEAGDLQAAVADLERALAFEPMLGNARLDMIRAQLLLGNEDDALRRLDQALAIPELAQSEAVLRARLSLWSPKIKQTLTQVTVRAGAAQTAPGAVSSLMKAIADGSSESAALDHLREYAADESTSKRYRLLMHQLLAENLGHLGQLEEAATHLDQAVAVGLLDLAWLERCPPLEPLRGSSAFTRARQIVSERAMAVRSALVG